MSKEEKTKATEAAMTADAAEKELARIEATGMIRSCDIERINRLKGIVKADADKKAEAAKKSAAK